MVGHELGTVFGPKDPSHTSLWKVSVLWYLFHLDLMFLELKANCHMRTTIVKVQINSTVKRQFKQKLFKGTVKHSCMILRYSSISHILKCKTRRKSS